MDATLVAQSLKSAREAAGMTMEQLADQVGVTRQAVGQWEAGSSPSGPARRLLAQIFNVELDVIDGWFEREEKSA